MLLKTLEEKVSSFVAPRCSSQCITAINEARGTQRSQGLEEPSPRGVATFCVTTDSDDLLHSPLPTFKQLLLETLNVATTTAEKLLLQPYLKENSYALPRLLLNCLYYSYERERESTAT